MILKKQKIPCVFFVDQNLSKIFWAKQFVGNSNSGLCSFDKCHDAIGYVQ